jgi:hypothetical protein
VFLVRFVSATDAAAGEARVRRPVGQIASEIEAADGGADDATVGRQTDRTKPRQPVVDHEPPVSEAAVDAAIRVQPGERPGFRPDLAEDDDLAVGLDRHHVSPCHPDRPDQADEETGERGAPASPHHLHHYG